MHPTHWKGCALAGLALCCVLPSVAAAQTTSTLFQQSPEGWKTEVLPFPLHFAPDLGFKGVEELRFPPGMSKPVTETYLSYAFIWWLEGQPKLDAKRLEEVLLKYYKGLYLDESKKKDQKRVDGFSVTVRDEDALSVDGLSKTIYSAQVNWVDPFVTENDVRSTLRIEQWHCTEQGRTALLFLTSPRPAGSPAWQKLATVKAGACS
jgi:hypothetical protein